jgi:hypothetical protein
MARLCWCREQTRSGTSTLYIWDKAKGSRYLVLQHGQEPPERLVPVEAEVWREKLNDSNQVTYTEIHESRWRELFMRVFGPNTSPGYHVSSFLRDPHRGLIPLERYMPGVRRFWVHDLNNSGCIVGSAWMRDGSYQTILLEPIPEQWCQ